MNIKLENIVKKFGTTTVLDKLNIEIEDGSLVSILGPSGCGKSTSLFIIAGLYEAEEGKILFNDVDVTNIEPKHREIGMVFQNYALYPHLTVLENIEFPLKMKKMKKIDRKNKAVEIGKLTQIEDLLNRKPSELSGGQQQRVAIARALVKNPKILLLDEPLSNLDARLRIEMREEIKRIQKEIKITTIFVTHDQEEAIGISDKILLLNKGKVQQYSEPKDMYFNPKNKFVASFLGNPQMNFIDGFIKEKNFISKNEKLKFSLKKLIDIEYFNEELTLGIRPEEIYITKEEDSLFSVIVKNKQIMGKEIYIEGILEDGTKITFIESWDNNININDKIYLNIKRVNIFNKEKENVKK